MAIDILILILFLLGIGLGLLRNPFMALIHLVLFIGFTYLFYFIFIPITPSLLSLFDISVDELATSLTNAFSSINLELNNLANSFNYAPQILDDTYLTNAYNLALINSLLSLIIFLISAVISLIVSYLFAWLIYGLLKKFVFKKREDIFKNKKPVKMLSSSLISFIFVFFSVSFIASPYQIVRKEFNNVLTSINLMEDINLSGTDALILKADDLKNNLNNLKTYVNDLNDLKNYYLNEANQVLPLVDDLSYKLNQMDLKVDRLLAQGVTSISSYSLSEISSTIEEGIEIIALIEENLDPYIDEFDRYEEEINSALNSIDDGIATIDQNINSFNETINVLTGVDEEINKMKGLFNDISFALPLSSWFDFMLNINYGYMGVSYEGADSLNIEFNKLVSSLDNIIKYNIEHVNQSIPSILTEAEEALNKGEETYLDGVNKLNEVNQMLEENKEVIDEALAKKDRFIEINDYINEIYDLVMEY